MRKNKSKKNLLSQRLENLRKRNGLSQEDLAEKLSEYNGCEKCTYQNISNWENDVYTPRPHYLIAYTNFFSCTLDYLYGTSNSPTMTKEEWEDEQKKERIKTWEDQKIRNENKTIEWINASIDSFIAYQNEYGDFSIDDTQNGYLVKWDEKRTVLLSRDEFEGFLSYIQENALLLLNMFRMSKQDPLIQQMNSYKVRKDRYKKKGESEE